MAWNSQISTAFTITARNNGDRELLLPMKSKYKLQYTQAKATFNLENSFPAFILHKYLQKPPCFTRLQEDKDKGPSLNHTKALNKQINKSNLKVSFTLSFYNGFTKLLHLYEQA